MALKPVLALIPARGGSKGIPGKNLRLLAGRPLIAYAADAARASGIVHRIILSTDSQEIAGLGGSLGIEVPFMRPPELATDESPMVLVLEHAVSELERTGWSPAVILLLQPTAPLRRPEHLVAALSILERTGCDSVVSVIEVPQHFSPHFVMRIQSGRLEWFLPEGGQVTRRQDVVPAYSRDGTVYAVRRDVLMLGHTIYGRDCRPLVLSAHEAVNLDTLEDWERAEALLARRSAASS